MLLLATFAVAVEAAEIQSDLEYGVAGGVSLRLDARVPDGPGPFPAVIIVHGGGWTGGDKRQNVPVFFDPLTAAGYAWFSINYRLAPAHKFPACVEDVEAAIRWVKANAARFRIDPGQVALVGPSAGGHLVSLVGTRGGPGLDVKTVVPIFGVHDLAAYGKDRPELLKNVFGFDHFDATAQAALEAASPAHHVRAGLPPFRLFHGDADKLVPYAQSVDFHAQLRAAGVVSSFTPLPGQGHGLRPAGNYPAQVVAWLDSVFKPPLPDTSPGRLDVLLRRNPAADADGDGQLTPAEAQAHFMVPAPAFANVPYGPDPRQVFDLWPAAGSRPTPLIIFIHGGGFSGGDKRDMEPALLRQALAAGVSCMAITYRWVKDVTINEIMRDAARALQTVRYRAADFNIDPTRIAAYGGSAGAGTSLWLAFHDDLADPASSDPIARESTRVVAVGAFQTQATYDMLAWEPIVGPYRPEWRKNLPAAVEEAVPGANFFHMKSRAELESPRGRELRADVDFLSMITSDDPPVFLFNREKDGPANNNGHWWHHPNHARAIEAACARAGVSVLRLTSQAEPRFTGDAPGAMLGFFQERFKSPHAGLPAGRLELDIEYARVGDEHLKLDAFTPAGPGPYSAVLIVHGGGWTGGDKAAAGIAPLFAPLARAGHAWFSVNYRLAPVHKFPACAEDVEAALRWVKAHAAEWRVDPDRIALLGFSAGGHLVSLVGARGGPGLGVRGVVAFSGVQDLAAYQAGHPAVLKTLFGRDIVDADAREALRAASPQAHVRAGLPPFLLLHGTADKLVDFSQAENFHAELLAAGGESDLFTITGAGHNVSTWPGTRPGWREKLLEWLGQKLPDAFK